MLKLIFLAPAKPTAAELRRQANIQRFGYDPNETPATVDTSYRGGHQPRGPQDENPVRLDDITISTTGESAGYPSDFYGPSGSKYYAPGPRFADDEFGVANQQSYRAIMKAKGNPDAEVTIYRAVPNEDSITSINEGDFVTLSPKYAEIHGSEGYGPNGNDAGKVISQKVKVKDIYFAGDDVNEFGYYPSQGRIVIAQATPSAEFTEEDLFEVVLDDGRSIIATDQHKFLTPDGWRQLSSLDTVASVLSARQKFDAYRHRSTSDTCLSGSRADALRCSQTHADCRGDCSECRRRCGQPPQWAADSAPAFALSPSDARQHSFRALSRWDDLERADRCNLSSFSRRRSTWAALASSALRYCAGWGSCIGERISEWPSAFCLPPALSPQMSFHLAQGPVSLARVLGLGILRNQVESPQMLHGISGRDVRNSFPSCDAFRGCGDFKVSKVESIRKHSRLKYWDLHVFGTNNYLSDGIVNHNSGKSHLFAEMLIERSIMGKVDAVCVREVQKSLAQSVKKLLENKINQLGVSHMFHDQRV
jgi:hypothetical protein